METISNPSLKYSNIPVISELAKSRDQKIIFAVDNTMLTSYFQRPIELGVDVVMYSLSKYMNGHNDVLGGALITNETEINDKLKVVQTKYGSVLSPFDCYMANRGLKTLALPNMNTECRNIVKMAWQWPSIRKQIQMW